jgi:hypothetical protein
MTPTSPLAGLLTGLLDGSIIALVVLCVVFLLNHRREPARIPVPPADEPRSEHAPAEGDLHRAA